MGLSAAELPAPDPPLALRKRLCEEMEALRGILRKAELVVRKTGDKGCAAPRRGKDGRFLAAKARTESVEANRIPCEKKRKTMLPVSEEIIKPRMMEVRLTPCAKRSRAMPPMEKIEHPQISKADQAPCAKKRRTTPPPMESIEPLISEDEIFGLVTRLSSLSSNMPARVIEFLNKECTDHANKKAGEIEIDLESMSCSAMSELHKLLDEFAEEEKRRQQKEELMKGEFAEAATRDTCGGDASHLPTGKDLYSPPLILKDREMTEEDVDICCDNGTIATEKFVETTKSPSNSSSSSSSGSSSSSKSSSGSSCSDSSDSDSSDSGSDDDECETSSLAPAVLPIPKNAASAIAMAVKGLCSPPPTLEVQDEEMTEEQGIICGNTGPIAVEKSPSHSSSSSSSGSYSSSSSSSDSGDSSSVSSSSDSSDSDSSDSDCDDECVTSYPAPAVVPKSEASPMAMPLKVVSPIAAEEFAETGKSRRSTTSSSSLLEDGEIEEEEPSGASPVAAEKFAESVHGTGSANDQSVRTTQAPAVCPNPSKPQPAAQDTARDLYARSFEKKRERQRAYEKPVAPAQNTVRDLNARGFEEKKHERQRAYEKPAARSTVPDVNARGFEEKKHERQRAYEKPAAQSTVRDLYARNVEMKHERQRAYEKVKEMERKRERQSAYKKLQEMERNAKPIFDWIHPRHLNQLGITRPVEYAVTSERRFAAPRGCPVQSLLGLFLKQSSRAGQEEMAME